MVEAFQNGVMRLAMCGLGVSLAAMALRSRPVRVAFARMLAIWRGLTTFGRFAVCSFLLVGILVGGDKTNSVGSLPPRQMVPPVERQGNDPRLTGLSANGNLADEMHLVQPQTTRTERRFANWSARGAWQDSFWLPFAEGWVFPHGSNHLSGVEIVSFGQLWTVPFGSGVVASIGEPVSIVPGLSSFAYELTPSNSYRFVWTDAAITRDTNNLVSAALELFRNGDVSVSTNGVAYPPSEASAEGGSMRGAYLPRELPFQHDGFGQDAEWVTANFTNATEILAVGYPQWVDAQVGEGLTNGLYKFTVTIPDDPPETVQLVVGDLSVAVTNAGEYFFLLEKGIEYSFGTGFPVPCVEYDIADDVPSEPLRMLRSNGGSAAPWTWTVDGGWSILQEPTGLFNGVVLMMPVLQGTPDVAHLWPEDFPATFTAVLSDCASPESVAYEWTSDGDVWDIATPHQATTAVSPRSMPNYATGGLSVSVNGNFSPNDVRWAITPQTGRITERRGYMVKVEPIASSGTVVVEARFNSDPHQPRFEMPIVQQRTIPVRAFVAKAPAGAMQIPNSRVVGMVEYANRIYEQVGIRFNLLSISRDVGTTNDWVLAEYDVDPMTGATNTTVISVQAQRFLDNYTSHDCVELYFLGKIVNKRTAAFSCRWGIVVSQQATSHVVAHEIGHALGLRDCYNYSEANSNTTKDFSKIDISGACFASMTRDWGSALGRGFYAKSDKYALVQQSFLMYGMDGFASVDIPDGAVLSIANKAMSVGSACHVPVGASAIKQNNSEVYSQ